MTREELLSLIPEFDLIADSEMKEKTILAMLDAVEEGGWDAKGGLTKCPALFGSEYAECPDGWLGYTRRLAGTAEQLFLGMGEWAQTKFDVDHDAIISGALLAGIGKLIEFDVDENGSAFVTDKGRMFRHPISGAWIAYKRGLPNKVIQIIVNNSSKYSPLGSKADKSQEGIFVKNADDLLMGVLKAIAVDRALKAK